MEKFQDANRNIQDYDAAVNLIDDEMKARESIMIHYNFGSDVSSYTVELENMGRAWLFSHCGDGRGCFWVTDPEKMTAEDVECFYEKQLEKYDSNIDKIIIDGVIIR